MMWLEMIRRLWLEMIRRLWLDDSQAVARAQHRCEDRDHREQVLPSPPRASDPLMPTASSCTHPYCHAAIIVITTAPPGSLLPLSYVYGVIPFSSL